NALTLSPALGALILRPRRKDARRGLAGRFFNGFDRAFASAQTGYVRGAQFLIRKVGVALLVLVAFALLAGGLGKTLPTSFMPQEDQGFFFMNVQLPEAASMQRTNAVLREIDEILKAEPGVRYVNAVSGYSLLSQTASPRNGLYFVQLTPYDERATRGLQADAIVASVNRKVYGLPEAQVFAFLPPSPAWARPAVSTCSSRIEPARPSTTSGRTRSDSWPSCRSGPRSRSWRRRTRPRCRSSSRASTRIGCSSSASRSRTCTRRSR